MAFLDNSGDIILDAVLTETGRKKLANGNFSIAKFALGDDEINYTTYNKNHASGSAYYDLEILQTPVLESTTQMNSNINYGLLAITNPNILYMPAIKVNEKLDDESMFATSGIYYVAANLDTHTALQASTALDGSKFVLNGYSTSSRIILFESGIDSSRISATTANRSAYLVAVDMIDSSFTIQADARFVATVNGLATGGVFTNNSSDELTETLSPAAAGTGVASTGLTNYSDYSVLGLTNSITDTDSGTSIWTALDGPCGTIGGVQFQVVGGLGDTVTRDSSYVDYGATGQNLFSDGNTYDYIDTTVYVVGSNSAQVIQLPIRITRKAS
jgi:hypothetical protein